ncbi:hypothetical protein LWI28_016169 [Acer negundo]|uniref:DUF7356 domain-containing protein n=1 Tax=Acer negundo TaxID=4023 RepID=A0AAD5I6G2_ACENE|nr:hypothetical protein LWI28_016169 [Acer negundo]KAK4852119.1 hypothetical protein QYF36_021262 [Acer negundo]
MDRNEILAVFLLFLIVADASNARFRDLAAASTNESATPVSNSNNELDQKPIGADKSNETKSEEVPRPSKDPKQLNATNLKSPNLTIEGTDNGRNSIDTNSEPVETRTIDKEKNPKGLNSSHTGVATPLLDNANTDSGKNSKGSNSTDSTMSPPGNGTNPGDSNAGTISTTSHGDGTKEKNNGDNNSSDLAVDETCRGLTNKCRINKLVACIKSFDEGSGNLSVLVQNEGEKTLRVKLTIPSAVENLTKQLNVSKHPTQMINISLAAGESPKVILNTEIGECLLQMAPLESEENAFMHLPSYDKLVTPINGAYFLILSVLIFGGTWACCKFRKRKRHDGVPYQELEMGLPDTASAARVESAEGWDQGWDDDWDEENSVKSPGAPLVGNISANGLTSRSSNKDGWENDWDD